MKIFLVNFKVMFYSKMSKYAFWLLSALMIVSSACAPTRFVEPLKKGTNAVSVSAGGPLVNVPGVATMPLPLSSVTYGRGVTEDITVYGSYFLTSSIFGTFQMEVGSSIRLLEHDVKNWGVSVAPALNFAFDRFEGNTKLWPLIDGNFYWKYNARGQKQEDLLTNKDFKANNLYLGLGSWFELSSERAHEETQSTNVIPMLHLGHDLNWKSWGFKFEVKFLAPFTSNENIVLDYKSAFGDYGATGLYLGFTRRF